MKYILKRDGSKEVFKDFKIEDAIKKAFKSVGVNYNRNIYVKIMRNIDIDGLKTVEEIQDLIEKNSL